MHRHYLTLLLGILTLSASAQMTVTDADSPGSPYTPENLITNTFLGEGVIVNSVTYSGDDAAVGYFEGAEGDIGLDRGVVMTSGSAEGAAGYGCDDPAIGCGNSLTDASTEHFTPGDPDLEQQGNIISYDAAVYEIEFVPLADTLRFRYVFASEEYPDYVCSQFNDIFGFYISGPGISGPFSGSAENIALIPGTNLPVAISSVNNGAVGNNGDFTQCISLSYSNFYSENPPLPFAGVNMEYDGYSDVFTATAIVVPCQTYTIKLAISDGGDGTLDSGVFLEAKSFGTGSVDIATVTPAIDGSAAEGCDVATLELSLEEPTPTGLTFSYTLGGTATPGTDYADLPPLTIPAGDSTLSVGIQAFEDGLVEGDETIEVYIQTEACLTDTFVFVIRDVLIAEPPQLVDETICIGDTIQLDATLPVTLQEEKTFVDSSTLDIPDLSTVEAPLTISGVSPATVGPGVVTSVCVEYLEHDFVGDLTLLLEAPDGTFITLSSENGGGSSGPLFDPAVHNDYGPAHVNTCFTPDATLPINSIITIAPFTGDFIPQEPFSDLYGAPTNGQWKLIVTDNGSGFPGKLYRWSINFGALYEVSYAWSAAPASPATLSCQDCPTPSVYPTVPTVYTLTAEDTYGCSITKSILVDPEEDPTPPPTITCGQNTYNSVRFEWEAVPGAVGYEVSFDSITWFAPTEAFAHTVGGLFPSDTVTMYFRSIGDCGPGEGTVFTCLPTGCLTIFNLVEEVPVSCFGGSDGSVLVTATDPDPPISYELNGVVQDNGSFSGLPPGDYSVFLTNGNFCVTEVFVMIPEPDTLTAQVTSTPTGCFDSSDGTATAIPTGGVPPYTYLWDAAAGNQTIATASGLATGSYTVTVTDSVGCVATASVMVEAPDDILISLTPTPVNCFGGADGSITAIATGGTGALTYSWSVPGAPASPILPNLAAGTYIVTVTDAANCTRTASAVVTQPAQPLLVQLTTTPTTCLGGSDGTASASVTGGTGSYTYQWSNGSSTPSLTGLQGGPVSVTITDANDCTTAATAVVSEPQPITATFATEAPSCFDGSDGSATVTTASGGQGSTFADYAFTWSTTPTQTAATAVDLTGGLTYTVTVTDPGGCTESFDILIPQPDTIVVTTVLMTPVDCHSNATGSVTVAASGTASPYSYAWDAATGSQSEATATGLLAGTYDVTVTDANGCTTVSQQVVSEPDTLGLDANIDPVSCPDIDDGAATVTATGGVGGYTYEWSDGLSDGSSIGPLPDATYTVTLTDANGCIFVQDVIIPTPDTLKATAEATGVTCHDDRDGEIQILPTGGTPPFQYRLDDGVLTAQSNPRFLSGGLYEIEVVDAEGCIATTTATIEVPDPLLVDIFPDTNRIDLVLGDSLPLFAEVTAAVGVPEYLWSVTNEIDTLILDCVECPDPLLYTFENERLLVRVTDERGCTATDELLVYVFRDNVVFVPTAFTPNGDGINEQLMVHGKSGTRILTWEVYDRWGELVYRAEDFEVNDTRVGFDGTFRGQRLMPGVLVWQAEVEYIDGRREWLKGNTTLVR